MKVKALGAITLVLVLADCTGAPDAEVAPDAPSVADYGTLMVDCLEEFGFEAEAQGTGAATLKPPSTKSNRSMLQLKSVNGATVLPLLEK